MYAKCTFMRKFGEYGHSDINYIFYFIIYLLTVNSEQ